MAHFHNVIIPSVVFGLLSGYHYWFPKAFGFRLHDGWGRIIALCWIFGFFFAFLPLYALGFMGMPRRTANFTDPTYLPLLYIALFGAAILLVAVISILIQLWISVRRREELAVPLDDLWNGRTLEWANSIAPTVLQSRDPAAGAVH